MLLSHLFLKTKDLWEVSQTEQNPNKGNIFSEDFKESSTSCVCYFYSLWPVIAREDLLCRRKSCVSWMLRKIRIEIKEGFWCLFVWSITGNTFFRQCFPFTQRVVVFCLCISCCVAEVVDHCRVCTVRWCFIPRPRTSEFTPSGCSVCVCVCVCVCVLTVIIAADTGHMDTHTHTQ